MEIGEILDRAKSANGIKTDMALADALGVGRAAVSAWRHGQRLPDPVQCATLAGLSGMPLAQVMGIVGEARAISREEKAVWRKLAGSVALLLCAIGFSGAVAPKALAHKGFATSFSSSAAEECLLCTRQRAGHIRSRHGSACPPGANLYPFPHQSVSFSAITMYPKIRESLDIDTRRWSLQG